jgi:hypothetical protein
MCSWDAAYWCSSRCLLLQCLAAVLQQVAVCADAAVSAGTNALGAQGCQHSSSNSSSGKVGYSHSQLNSALL